jgi:arylsulfatase A-like enzyme
MKKECRFLGITIASVAVILNVSFKNKEVVNPPNILYILADDLGYGDVTAYNHLAKTSTPNIDRLASQGIRFTDAHSSSSVCTPTRYGILTGRYCWRTILKNGVLGGESPSLIEKGRTTIASFLKENGYNTGIVGKWHLGVDWVKRKDDQKGVVPYNSDLHSSRSSKIDYTVSPTNGPLNHGFDYSFIFPGTLDAPPYCFLENDKLVSVPDEFTVGNKPDEGPTGSFWRAGPIAKDFDFKEVTPIVTQKAISFLKGKSMTGKPFFLYLPFPSPHTPWEPSSEFIGSSKAGQYGDYVNMVDAQVGKVLQTLTEMGLDNNTLVFFTSDNGPYWTPEFIERFGHRAASVYRGMKADPFEGGHRIPFIARWPGKIKPGVQCSEPVTLTNLLATCAEILRKNLTENEGEDSHSILPLLLGDSTHYKKPEALIQHSGRGQFVVRKGDWKLILSLEESGQPARSGGNQHFLFNLKDDPSETKDLYLINPLKVKELNAILEKFKTSGRSR